MSDRYVPFVLCDVFTECQFAGNQLAVIPDGSSLTSEEMQKIAQEFNFSECTFVLQGDDTASHRIRIFTPTHEVPFAGHPNVGTAHVLASEFSKSERPKTFRFREDAGLVDVAISQTGRGMFCEIKAPEKLTAGSSVEPSEVAAALTLPLEGIDISIHPPLIASVGLPFIIARVTNREILSSAHINMAGFEYISNNYPCQDILIYCEGLDGVIHSRVFAPFDNVPEDPATGSANGALVALLTLSDSNSTNERSFKVHQGDDMGRPCRLFLRTVKNDQSESNVYIGGYSKIVGKGQLIIEPASLD